MTVSATNGAFVRNPVPTQESEVTLDSASCCDSRDPLVEVTAGWFCFEEIKSIIGYAVAGAIAVCPVDDSIPHNSAITIGGSFSEGVGDPSRGLVSDGCKSVAMPVVGLTLQGRVFDEEFWFVAPSNQVPLVRFRYPQPSSEILDSLVQELVGKVRGLEQRVALKGAEHGE